MNNNSSRRPLIVYFVGFTLAACCAVWAGSRFAATGSNLGFGVLTGLSVGAMFAFGQRIRQYFFPAAPSSAWKVNAGPGTDNLRPAQCAAARARPLTVSFDDTMIQSTRNGAMVESIAWQDIRRITITIGDDFLPMPYWVLATAGGGIRLPNDTPGLEELTQACKTKLPGYDSDATYKAVIAAMGSMEGSFDIWQTGATA